MTNKTALPKLIVGAADITKAIESIQRRGEKLDADIQHAGLSILSHIDQHGDVTLLCRLFTAMPKGSRRNALAEWAFAFGKVKPNLDSTSSKELPFLLDKEGSTDLEAAAAKPWYTFKPEKPVSEEFDFAGMLQALIKKADAAKAAGKVVKGGENLGSIAALLASGTATAMVLPEPVAVQ